MNKKQLVQAAAKSLDNSLTQNQVNSVLAALLAQIERAVANGEEVVLSGFGRFRPRKINSRVIKGALVDRQVKVEEHYVPAFKPGKTFKKNVRGVNE